MASDDSSGAPNAASFYTTEYSALRAELMDHLQTQSQALVYVIAAFSALFAFALANRMVAALLLYPLISAVFFWRWTTAGASVGSLGRYIRRIENKLLGPAADPPGWEHQMAGYVGVGQTPSTVEKPQSRWNVNKEFYIAKIIFVVPALLAVIASWLPIWVPDPAAKVPPVVLDASVERGAIWLDLLLTLVIAGLNFKEYKISRRW